MARFRQDLKTGKLVPIDKAAQRKDSLLGIHGDIQSFVSPVDGSIISDRKQLREHNIRNGVVNQAEFSPEWLDKKAKERDRFYQRDSEQETRKRKMELNEKIERALRQ